MAIIKPISRLRKIAELTDFEKVIASLARLCFQIAQQATLFIETEINPALNKVKPERDAAKQQLEIVDKRIETLKRNRSESTWLEKQRQQAQSQLAVLDREVTRLGKQREELLDYIQSANSIQV